MKVIHLGYGIAPRMEGGAAAIQSEMIRWMTRAGVTPVVIQGGRFDFHGKLRVEERLRENIKVYDVINCPNWAGMTNPVTQMCEPEIERVIGEIVRAERPHIVHAHELTFFSARTLVRLRTEGFTVVKTIHNYWDICPQRDLLFQGVQQCSDFHSGEKCRNCRVLPEITPKSSALSAWVGHGAVGKMIRPMLRQMIRRSRVPPLELPAPAVQYEKRRGEFVEMLNGLNAIHVYSRGAGEILEKFGVSHNLVHYIPVSTESIDRLVPADRTTVSDKRTRFIYRGGLAPNKGVNLLVDAFRRLDQGKATLAIHGSGDPRYERILRRSAEGLNVNFHGRYMESDIGKINARADVGIVPSLAMEVFGLVGIEYLNTGVPVIASHGGGVRDYILDGINGLLFANGDVSGLEHALRRCTESAFVEKLRAGIRPWPKTALLQERLFELYRNASEKAAA
jgi:glycosyltransferase involved in cell wall biosynthesis